MPATITPGGMSRGTATVARGRFEPPIVELIGESRHPLPSCSAITNQAAGSGCAPGDMSDSRSRTAAS